MSDWIEHDGKGCPVAPGTLVEAMLVGIWVATGRRCPEMGLHRSRPWRALVDDNGDPWFFGRNGTSEVRLYRVLKPRALQKLIEEIESLPTPVVPMVPVGEGAA